LRADAIERKISDLSSGAWTAVVFYSGRDWAAHRMNPRVLLLTTYFRPIVGGVESNAERLAGYLHSDGFLVRVLTKRVRHSLPDVEETDGVRIDRIGPFGERSALGKWQLLPSALSWLVRHAS